MATPSIGCAPIVAASAQASRRRASSSTSSSRRCGGETFAELGEGRPQRGQLAAPIFGVDRECGGDVGRGDVEPVEVEVGRVGARRRSASPRPRRRRRGVGRSTRARASSRRSPGQRNVPSRHPSGTSSRRRSWGATPRRCDRSWRASGPCSRPCCNHRRAASRTGRCAARPPRRWRRPSAPIPSWRRRARRGASCCDSNTSGTVVARRPPNRNAEIGTPAGSCHSGAIDGHCAAGTQNREFGCAAGRPAAGVHDLPRQSVRCAGGSWVMSSHHTSPSSVSAVFVNTVLRSRVCIAFGFDRSLVPGATPKNPNSGLIAWRRPFGAELHPRDVVADGLDLPAREWWGSSIARLVLPQADGNAAAK